MLSANGYINVGGAFDVSSDGEGNYAFRICMTGEAINKILSRIDKREGKKNTRKLLKEDYISRHFIANASDEQWNRSMKQFRDPNVCQIIEDGYIHPSEVCYDVDNIDKMVSRVYGREKQDEFEKFMNEGYINRYFVAHASNKQWNTVVGQFKDPAVLGMIKDRLITPKEVRCFSDELSGYMSDQVRKFSGLRER